jgi:hypothetical protein
MSTIRWWTDGDRYYENDGQECEVVEVLGHWVAISCDHEIIATDVYPAGCSVCECTIAPDAPYRLCASCEGKAKAKARAERERQEYAADVGRSER